MAVEINRFLDQLKDDLKNRYIRDNDLSPAIYIISEEDVYEIFLPQKATDITPIKQLLNKPVYAVTLTGIFDMRETHKFFYGDNFILFRSPSLAG